MITSVAYVTIEAIVHVRARLHSPTPAAFEGMPLVSLQLCWLAQRVQPGGGVLYEGHWRANRGAHFACQSPLLVALY